MFSFSYRKKHANQLPDTLDRRDSQVLARAAISGAVDHEDSGINVINKAPIFVRPKDVREKELHRESLSLGEYEPVFSAKQVHERYGLDIGALTTVIQLPAPEMADGSHGRIKPKLIYCFSQTSSSGKHAASETTYYIMGQKSLDALYTTAVTGGPLDESAIEDVVTLTQETNQDVVIGRGENGWLPELGYHAEVIGSDHDSWEQYATVSKSQATLRLDPAGALEITDLQSYNGTVVYFGAPTQSALSAETGQFVTV